ncbi:MAG: hypothetical protein UY81_C0006G0011 [Candidatus Giovannonibacteria bacterium GW2011_GWA2_53_7]|uniref:Uncharacterized protein n=1 Tax=Candidatus Giovannonibacteria bacterium GW2011_GWA2_53_7 TaxID=1618650 RepID=A0A0G2A7Y3_9BACT|nr:MAG: hypothetical protein UY81_C0006G0011 [Candidatus Giovannonibacteria bacterium GW2011_GWA2_53_7]
MKRGIILLTFFLGGAFSFAHVAFAGFGITPPYVHNNTLRPGSEYTQEIIIVRSDPVEDLDTEVTLNLPGIEQWFSIDRGIKFVLPKGESQVKMHVIVRVPDDAKLGAYNGNIRIRTTSQNAPTTGVSLALGAQIDVHIKVVEEIFDFEVRRVELYEAEEGYKQWWLDFPGKVNFAMHIENTGNIPAAPPLVHIDIYDTAGVKLLESSDHTNKVEQILPFATKKVYANFPTWLPPGGYRVKYKIVKGEDAVAQEGELSLSILPRGTIPNYESYGFAGLRTGDKLSIILPGVILLLLVLVFFFGKKRRQRRPPRTHHHEHREDDPPPQTRRTSENRGGVVDLSRRR